MGTNEIQINRDTDNDVLYVTKAGIDKSNTINVNMSADILVRLDRSNNQVAGLTIEDFSKVMPHLAHYSDYQLMEKFDSIIDFLEAPNLVNTQ